MDVKHRKEIKMVIIKGRWLFDIDSYGTVAFTSLDYKFLWNVTFIMFPDDGHVDVIFLSPIRTNDIWTVRGGIAVDGFIKVKWSPAGNLRFNNRSGKGFKSIKRAIRFARKLMLS